MHEPYLLSPRPHLLRCPRSEPKCPISFNRAWILLPEHDSLHQHCIAFYSTRRRCQLPRLNPIPIASSERHLSMATKRKVCTTKRVASSAAHPFAPGKVRFYNATKQTRFHILTDRLLVNTKYPNLDTLWRCWLDGPEDRHGVPIPDHTARSNEFSFWIFYHHGMFGLQQTMILIRD